jgi:hypothetical protein
MVMIGGVVILWKVLCGIWLWCIGSGGMVYGGDDDVVVLW